VKLAGSQVLAERLKSPFLEAVKEAGNEDFDLVVLCGGDGTMLHVSSLFQERPCPPILPFSLGSLGFMTTFGKGQPEFPPLPQSVFFGGFGEKRFL
jgi:NAD kinase